MAFTHTFQKFTTHLFKIPLPEKDLEIDNHPKIVTELSHQGFRVITVVSEEGLESPKPPANTGRWDVCINAPVTKLFHPCRGGYPAPTPQVDQIF